MSEAADTRPTGGPVLWCLLAAALFGASTPASKPLLGGLSPLLLSGVLYLGAAVAVAPWALRGLSGVRQADRANLGRLAGAVLFGGVLGPVLLLTGLSLATAASVSLWLNLETVATAVLARVFFKEHLDRNTWLAVALVIVASVMLSPATPGGGLAVGLVALACLAWGLDNNFTAVIDRFSPAQVTFAKGVIAGAVNLALGALFDPSPAAAWAVGAGLVIGAVSYGASLLLYIAGAQHLGATRSQLIFSTAPAWGLGLAWLALDEELRLVHLAAAALMAVAIWLWHRERHSHHHRHVRLTHRHRHRHDDGHHQHEHATPVAPGTWHSHEHNHEPIEHAHPHRPDLHHRHEH
ncbi:DMT family transporter [Haliangium sp.]|uniref:DMT family transporter n=1 Tax=Haliangium sp. TaxID=2663208 RepID=UPI003D0E5BAE